MHDCIGVWVMSFMHMTHHDTFLYPGWEKMISPILVINLLKTALVKLWLKMHFCLIIFLSISFINADFKNENVIFKLFYILLQVPPKVLVFSTTNMWGIYIYMCVYIYIYICVCVCVRVCVCACVHIYIYIYIHTTLNKNLRPPLKMKKKILFIIF